MSEAEFEAYTTGKTFEFRWQGQGYGAEQYLQHRQVRWRFRDDECVNGFWYPEGEAICFAYEGREDPQCWRVEMSGSGMVAQFLGESGVDSIYEARQSSGPLDCPGPRVGA